MVLVNWAYSYLTLRRGARLITHERPEPAAPALPAGERRDEVKLPEGERRDAVK